MPNHSIGGLTYEFWDGSGPHLVQQTVENFTRPGVNGIGQQLAGIRGAQFEAILTSHHSSYGDAILQHSLGRALTGAGLLVVIYNGINFYSTFQHLYSVDRYDPIDTHAAMLIGPSGLGFDYYYPNGAVAVGRFLLSPHT